MIARMATRFSAVAMLFALFAAPAVRAQDSAAKAPDPGKVAVIEEIFTITKPEQLTQQMLEQAKATIASQGEKAFTAQVPASEDAAKTTAAYHEFQDQLFAFIAKQLDWQKLKPQYIAIYDETFTLPELEGMLTFYRSPAGQAVVTKMPTVMSKGMAVGQDAMRDLLPEIQKMAADFAANIKKAQDSERAEIGANRLLRILLQRV